MTNQTPLSLGTGVIKRQPNASTGTANMALASGNDLTLREHANIFTFGGCMRDPESTEADDCSLEPTVKSSQANAGRHDPDVNPEKILREEALGEGSMMKIATKLERRLEALERFPNKRRRQSATLEQRKPGEYLAKQREACKRMLKREMKASQKEEEWHRTWDWVGGGDGAMWA